jgi:type II restriction enzyme
MATIKQIQKLTKEALIILSSLGVPLTGLTERRLEKMAKAFLAVAGMKPGIAWSQAKDSASDGGHQLQSRQVIGFMNAHLGENISPGSYDDIRRKDLVLTVEALIVLKSAKNPDANTNDGTRGFALNPSAARVIRCFGTDKWKPELNSFMSGKAVLAEELSRKRGLARIPVTLSEGHVLSFSPGNHNQLQKHIIEDFLPLYGYGAEVLYVGDTENKSKYANAPRLAALNFFELAHDKLPDVVAYSIQKNWLFLIEAVTTANPINELRLRTLKQLTEQCTANVVYITAFPDRATYRKFAHDIAWETEVWLADAPEHMIHFNGDKFLGPYGKS